MSSELLVNSSCSSLSFRRTHFPADSRFSSFAYSSFELLGKVFLLRKILVVVFFFLRRWKCFHLVLRFTCIGTSCALVGFNVFFFLPPQCLLFLSTIALAPYLFPFPPVIVNNVGEQSRSLFATQSIVARFVMKIYYCF